MLLMLMLMLRLSHNSAPGAGWATEWPRLCRHSIQQQQVSLGPHRPTASLRPTSQLLTADQGGTLCVWSLRCGRLRLRLPLVHGEQRISAMCLDHNCRRLFTGSEAGPIKVGRRAAASHHRWLSPGPPAVQGVHAWNLSRQCHILPPALKPRAPAAFPR
jgi:hypothetical protein